MGCDWWQAIVAQTPTKFEGRMLLLVEFGLSGENFVARAGLKLSGENAEFKGIWGWLGSNVSGILAPLPPAPSPVPRSLPSSSSSAPPSAPSLRSSAASGGRPTWEQTKATLKFRREGGQLVASMPALAQALNKDRVHTGQMVLARKRRRAWTDQQVFKAPRVSRQGGSDERVGAEPVLRNLHDELASRR